MSDAIQEEAITQAINNITEKLSKILLDEFLKLNPELQLNIILIKSAQLLLANILCHISLDKAELEKIIFLQGEEIKELTLDCALSGFADKFKIHKH